MNEMDEIVKLIKSGELVPDNDESGAGGFWDLSYYIFGNYLVDNDKDQETVERIYNALWELYYATQKTL